ncbi:MAG: hypothetical protein HKM93_19655 [Desulfobacteraceae bacterium]|nr:hypothetical protein [Desulfobacteraceae bacterium]
MRKLLIVAMLVFSFGIWAQAADYAVEAASEKQQELLEAMVNEGCKVKKLAVVKSQNHELAYYIGAEIKCNDEKKSFIGFWLMPGPKDDPEFALSVDDNAARESWAPPPSAAMLKADATDKECGVLSAHFKK